MKCILKMMSICLTAIFLGTLALMAVYCIPTDTIYHHLQKDKELFQKEGAYWTWAKKPHTRLDGYTDSIMLMNAGYPVGEIPYSAMAVLKWYDKYPPDQTLVNALENKENFASTSYFRYWHGYLVYLKPILYISSYHDFRMLNAYFQFFLIMAALILLYLRLGAFFTIAFSLTILFINPVTTAMSLQLSSIFYVTMISVLLILWKNDSLYEKKLYAYFFLIIGIITSYIDLLTYPVVGVGIPMLFYILLNRNSFLNEKKVLLSVIKNSFAWGFGYIAMWAGKWMTAYIILGYSIMPEVFDAIQNRTSNNVGREISGHEPVNLITVLQANFKAAIDGPWIYIFAVFLIYLIYRIIKNRAYKATSPRGTITIFFVGLFPIVWYGLTLNHSFVHASFLAFRDLATFFFALLAIAVDFALGDKKTQKNGL